MSSQLDYWKSIKAKNAENASQKAHSNQDVQDSQSSTQSRFSDTDYSRRGYSQAHQQVCSQSPQHLQSQSRAQSHSQSRLQTNPRTRSQEYSSTRSQLRGQVQVHGQAQLHGQQPHVNSQMRSQVNKRPLRNDRVLRSQDFLQSRDDEIMDRPSAGYRHENQPDGAYRGVSGRYRSFNERYGIGDQPGIEPENETWFRSPSRFGEVNRGGDFRDARQRHDYVYGESDREARDFSESRVAREGREGRATHEGRTAREAREAHTPRGVRGVAARVAGNVADKIPFGGRDRHDAASTKVSSVATSSSVVSQTATPSHSDAGSTTKSPHDARKLGKSYMPGLDGLRALAVLAVLLYHISPNQFIGGYIGVDLFFVISGFLITYRNLQNIQNPNKTFTLKNFWLRRARRLIPALVLVILVCVPIGAIIYPDILVGAFRQVAGALTYSTNWVEIIHGSNYFDQANPSLFKNFWSLAVEEQFYIIWPPLLLLLLSRRLKNSQLVTIVATIAVASMVLMGVLAAPDNYTRVYYGTDTHCFGLAMGVHLEQGKRFALEGMVERTTMDPCAGSRGPDWLYSYSDAGARYRCIHLSIRTCSWIVVQFVPCWCGNYQARCPVHANHGACAPALDRRSFLWYLFVALANVGVWPHSYSDCYGYGRKCGGRCAVRAYFVRSFRFELSLH